MVAVPKPQPVPPSAEINTDFIENEGMRVNDLPGDRKLNLDFLGICFSHVIPVDGVTRGVLVFVPYVDFDNVVSKEVK